jgi:hypothetical protein
MSVPLVPSPKSIVIDVMALPEVGCATMANTVVVPGVGFVVVTLTDTTSAGRGRTFTDVVVVVVSPNPSTPVTIIR